MWWELPPWSAGVYPSKEISVTSPYKLEEEDEHTTSACQSASRHQVLGNDGGQRFQKEGMADKTTAVSKAWAHVVEKEVGRSQAIKSGRFQVLGEIMESGPNTKLTGPVLDETHPMCKRASLGGKKPMNPKLVDPKPSKQAIVCS